MGSPKWQMRLGEKRLSGDRGRGPPIPKISLRKRPREWGQGFTAFKRRPRRGCVSGASTPRANPEGSKAQDAIGKTEMAVVVPTKSPAPGGSRAVPCQSSL
jgi:hypothetical protein